VTSDRASADRDLGVVELVERRHGADGVTGARLGWIGDLDLSRLLLEVAVGVGLQHARRRRTGFVPTHRGPAVRLGQRLGHVLGTIVGRAVLVDRGVLLGLGKVVGRRQRRGAGAWYVGRPLALWEGLSFSPPAAASFARHV
jgi:hypothetical protein